MAWCTFKRNVQSNSASSTHVPTLPNCNPLAQTAASHSLPNIPPFDPSLIVPASPSLAVASCVYICLLFLVCPNQCSGAVWKSRGPSWAPVSNKPTVSAVCVSVVKFGSVMAAPRQPKLSLVCHWWMASCVDTFLPSPHHPTCLLGVLLGSVLVLFGCIHTPASHSKS